MSDTLSDLELTEPLERAAADYRAKSGHESSYAGERIWWEDIQQEDRKRITEGVREYANLFGAIGYRVNLNITRDMSDVRLTVEHRKIGARALPSVPQIEVLKGAVSAMLIHLHCGGSRSVVATRAMARRTSIANNWETDQCPTPALSSSSTGFSR